MWDLEVNVVGVEILGNKEGIDMEVMKVRIIQTNIFVSIDTLFSHDIGPYHKETSSLICSSN